MFYRSEHGIADLLLDRGCFGATEGQTDSEHGVSQGIDRRFREDHEVEELQIMLNRLADNSKEALSELLCIAAFAGHTSSMEYLLGRRPPD